MEERYVISRYTGFEEVNILKSLQNKSSYVKICVKMRGIEPWTFHMQNEDLTNGATESSAYKQALRMSVY